MVGVGVKNRRGKKSHETLYTQNIIIKKYSHCNYEFYYFLLVCLLKKDKQKSKASLFSQVLSDQIDFS